MTDTFLIALIARLKERSTTTDIRRFVPENTPDHDAGIAAGYLERLALNSLLRRYMQHIVNEEGVSYVGETQTGDLREMFSDEEIEVLRTMSREFHAKDT